MSEFIKNYKKSPYILEKEDMIVEVNDSFIDLSGFRRDEILNITISKVFGELFRTNIKINAAGTGVENVLFTKSFDVRFVSIEIYKISEANEFLYVFNEKENSRIENKLMFVDRLISDNRVGIGIFTTPDLMLVKANQTYLNYLPKPYNSKKAAYGKCLEEFISNYKGSCAEKVFTSVIDTNESLYITEKQGLMIEDDKRYWDSTIIPIVENEQVKYVVSMIDDVTERVLSRKHIRVKNQQLRAIFDDKINKIRKIKEQKKELEIILENMSDGLVVIDKNGKFIKVNRTVKEAMKNKIHVGTRIEEYCKIMELEKMYYNENGQELPPEHIPSCRILRGETVKQQRIIMRNGLSEKHFNYNATPIFNENGDFQYGIVLSHDVTDIILKENMIKQQQELLLKAEKEKREILEKALIMKDEFISLISHEFRTPLNVIYAAIQSIEHLYFKQIPERVRGLIGNIKQNTFRQLRLVNNLLDITRLNSGRFKLNMKNIDIVFLTKVIMESIELYANQKNIKLEFRSNLKCKIIGIDDEKYERIILNLLSNALKFTKEGGTISISIAITKNRECNMVCIKVADTGIGIPEDKKELIFERFGQVDSDLSRQAEGTGIGLSLVKLLIDNLGGTIDLDSRLGSGSVFTIMLPDKKVLEDKEFKMYLDSDNRLVNSIKVEFSDIYLERDSMN